MAGNAASRRKGNLPVETGSKTPADSIPVGEGSSDLKIWFNDRGEVCYGNECFAVAIDDQRSEIRVNVKQSSACELDPFINALKDILGEGARTVFEVETELTQS